MPATCSGIVIMTAIMTGIMIGTTIGTMGANITTIAIAVDSPTSAACPGGSAGVRLHDLPSLWRAYVASGPPSRSEWRAWPSSGSATTASAAPSAGMFRWYQPWAAAQSISLREL